MISIELNSGEFLDLFPDTSISIKLVSPVGQNETVQGSISLPFSLPPTAKNAKAMGFPHVPQASERLDINIKGRIFLKGLPWKTGTLKVLGATKRLYSVAFTTDVSEIGRLLEQTGLRDVDYGGVRTIDKTTAVTYNEHLKVRSEGTVDDYDYTFGPVFNPNQRVHAGGSSQNWNEFVNSYSQISTSLNFFRRYDDVFLFGLRYAMFTPFPYLTYVMDRVMNHVGWTIAGDFTTDPDIKKAVLWSNYVFYALYSYQYLYQGSEQTTNQFDLADVVPDMPASDFILAIMAAFNLLPNADAETSTLNLHFATDVLTADIVDLREFGEVIEVSQKKLEGLELSFKEDKEDALQDELIDPTDHTDQGTVQSFSNLPALPAMGDVYTVLDTNTVYLATSVPGSGIQFISAPGAHRFVTSDTDRRKITADMVGSDMRKGGKRESTGVLWLTPRIDQTARVFIKGITEPDQQLRLLFQRGLQQDSIGNTYPMLTMDIYDFNFAQVAGSKYAIRWNGDNGLKAEFHDQFDDFISDGKKLKVDWNPTLKEVLRWSFFKRYSADGVVLIPQALDLQINMQGIQSAVITGLKQ